MTMDRQRELEKEMLARGEARMQNELNKARDHHQASRAGAYRILVQQLIEPTAAALKEYLKATDPSRRGRGKPPIDAKLLRDVPVDVAAYLTSKLTIDLVCSPIQKRNLQRQAVTWTYLAGRIAMAIEDELRFGHLAKTEPDLWNFLQKKFKHNRSQNYTYLRRSLSAEMRIAGVDWDRWGMRDRIRVGTRLLDLMMTATGAVELELAKVGKKHRQYIVKISPQAKEWIALLNRRLIRPQYLPTLVPPKPWTTPTDGGYFFIQRPLVKTRDQAYQESLASADMDTVLASTNALQETAWRINHRVYAVAHELFEAGHPLDVLVNKEMLPLPPRLSDEDAEDAHLMAQARRARFLVHSENARRDSKRSAIEKALGIAADFEDKDAFFYPHQLDWRGRAYTMPQGLSPQGPDLERGLIQFADGVPLGESGVEWLAIHGANCWGQGIDKLPLEERIQWIGENEQAIRDAAEDPAVVTTWHEAEKPWQFLAFCFEWISAIDHPDGMEAFESHLPVHMDGSCNGLQHFAALLRDEVGGKAVNLVPGGEPADVYSEVLERLVEKVEAVAHEHVMVVEADDAMMAARWLASGLLTRKLVKRPVMTLPYGVSFQGTQDHMYSEVVADAVRRNPELFGEDKTGFRHILWLNKLLWEAIEEVILGGRRVMLWLQQIAVLMADENLPIYWRTPAGFPVKHAKRKVKYPEVKTRIAGKICKLNVYVERDEISRKDQKTGIAPNFVHSLDAAHLSLTIARCKADGIDAFAMIHDSYGTHAGHAATMARHLREAFVDMYEGSDPLDDLLSAVEAVLPASAEIPPLPPRGTLELRDVLDSEFFFA